MKIAISGKGGVGKTLVASLLAKAFASGGYSVIAIDADPDTNLAATLGFPDADKITPVSEMKELVQERTETRPGEGGAYFKINPTVEDLPDKYSVSHGGIRLMVMGQMKGGGGGCYCPENALLASLLAHLLIARDEVVILDMAAGIEHLGRGTAKSVDKLIVVVEPGRASIETAFRIKKLAADIGIENLVVVANKIHSQSDIDSITARLSDFEMLGFVPYDQELVNADINNQPVLESSAKIKEAVTGIYNKLIANA